MRRRKSPWAPVRQAISVRWLVAFYFALCLPAGSSWAVGACTAANAVGESAAQPCLTTLVQTDSASGVYGFNALEMASAKANDASYASLLNTCGPSGTGCGGSQLLLFSRLRNLEDNADELLGFGETQYSLHLPAQLLGNSLRWTADEEYSAQSSLTNRYASNQFAGVSNRLSALRFIAQTQRFARSDAGADENYDNQCATCVDSPRGGGASGDTAGAQWSVFANGTYGAGSKQPTAFNDAFSFAGTTSLAGADVHWSPTLVFGVLLDDIQQHADFDSSRSIVGGNVKGSGGGITAYTEKNVGDAYLNLSLGFQRISLHTRRVVTYGSNNPEVASVNTTFTSNTNATSLLATAGGGYTFYMRGFSAQPYLNWQYLRTHINGFGESAVGTDPEFATSVVPQTVNSLIGIAGVKFQYAWSPPFGVILPYGYGEFRREFLDHSQNVSSAYQSSAFSADSFQLPTDAVDPNYYEVGGGVVAVLAHRLQLYVQYMRILRLQYYSDYGVSGGFRFDFQ